VEATKFTEVGYVGRDVESIVRDLAETAVRMVRQERMESVKEKARQLAEERILDVFVPQPKKSQNPLGRLFGGEQEDEERGRKGGAAEISGGARMGAQAPEERRTGEGAHRDRGRGDEPPDGRHVCRRRPRGHGWKSAGHARQLHAEKSQEAQGDVEQARKIFTQEEAGKLIDMDEVEETAIKVAERSGIVFLDEIDKVATKGNTQGADVSREGVQRDILPIVEGSTVMTKYGPVKTDHVLFIAAGAFHTAKPSDLIPELQGRFPIRVELNSLRKEDFERILSEPQNALLKQYQALLATEGIDLEFRPEAISRIAQLACDVNEQAEDIGARRLHTLLEKLLEDVSFDAPELEDKHVVIDEAYVEEKLHDIVKNRDLSQFIL
jgi:ATP-dependent HslUV protease ATP-binding subunit HslU